MRGLNIVGDWKKSDILLVGTVEEDGTPGSVCVVSILEDVVTFHLGMVNYPGKKKMA